VTATSSPPRFGTSATRARSSPASCAATNPSFGEQPGQRRGHGQHSPAGHRILDVPSLATAPHRGRGRAVEHAAPPATVRPALRTRILLA
jgi:hypothetical protein